MEARHEAGRERPRLGLTASSCLSSPLSPEVRSPNMQISPLLLVAFLLGPGLALILREVSLPAYILAGSRARLDCDYDTQGEEIYSVKWYKGGREIFRYQPSLGERPISVYSRAGVDISQVRRGPV